MSVIIKIYLIHFFLNKIKKLEIHLNYDISIPEYFDIFYLFTKNKENCDEEILSLICDLIKIYKLSLPKCMIRIFFY